MNLLQKLTNWYFKREALPYWCVFIFDCAATFLAGLIVFWAYHKTLYNIAHFWGIVHTIFIYVFIAMIGFRTFRTYSGVLRYSSFVDLQHIAYANILSLMVAILAHYPLYQLPAPLFEPFRIRHLIVMYAVSTTLMWAGRVLIKELYELSSISKGVANALVYGVKEGGVGLAKSVRNEKPSNFHIRGFISHNGDLNGHLLMGVGVYQVEDLPDVLDRFRIRAVLVSPQLNNEFRNDQQLQSMLTDAGVKIYMTKGYSEGTDIDKMQLKEVSIDDLLPRDEINVDMESLDKMLKGQRILITGSAGSIGSEMVRQIAKFAPAEMMLIDQAETPQHDIRLMMRKQFPDIKVQAVVTSICKEQRMERIFSDFRPDYVFHAAAYKHVPMMEDNPSESVQNNVLGTKILADLSVKYGVKKFVMISTDKAVNPTNVMGCSKRICEIYVQALDSFIKRREERGERRENTLDKTTEPFSTIQNNSEHEPQASERLNRSFAASQPFSTSLNLSQLPPQGSPCQFVTTRFGNVLGSNGSVIPLFERQIKEGGPVTVTDPEIIRYFMLIPEACKLVLEAGTMGNGGEIFVFDMGKPVKIADLAKRMILLSGAKNIEIKYTGLRPGEKLYEEMLSTEENTKPSFHEKIRIATVREYDFEKVSRDIDDLISISRQYDDMATVRKMKEIVPEFISNNSVYSALDSK
jgi:FlaA1/EpsC-like NDP-sugar epimerase